MGKLTEREQAYLQTIKRYLEHENTEVFLCGLDPALQPQSPDISVDESSRFSPELESEMIKLGVIDAKVRPTNVKSPAKAGIAERRAANEKPASPN